MSDEAEPKKKRKRKRRRRIRLHFDLHKAMFVLPNLFTVSGIFCGFYSIVLSSQYTDPAELRQAGIAIFFGIFFDMVDGRVARLTRTQSEFGVQLDSLADLVTFGVAPGLLLYQWGLSEFGVLGSLIAFFYVACGAIRLARFNVMAQSPSPGALKFFIGLPIPLAAGTLVSIILSIERLPVDPNEHPGQIVGIVLLLSYLMVSSIRYRSFKNVRPTPKNLVTFVAILAGFVVAAAMSHTVVVLTAFSLLYIAFGLCEEVLFRLRRSNKRTVAPKQRPLF